jgi:hypothetical protein
METLATPITFTNPKTVYSFTIESVIVNINTSATIQVNCFDTSGNNIGNKSFTMEHTDYVQWGTDDGFIVAFVKEKLALIDCL